MANGDDTTLPAETTAFAAAHALPPVPLASLVCHDRRLRPFHQWRDLFGDFLDDMMAVLVAAAPPDVAATFTREGLALVRHRVARVVYRGSVNRFRQYAAPM